MKIGNQALLAAVCVGVSALLLACGGGGGGSTPTAQTLSGVAATGGAFDGAIITVTDKVGTVVGNGTAVGVDGKFNITLSLGAQAPFVLSASRTTADGAVETLVSVVPTATTSTTVNISPVTNLIASRLSSSGDPNKLASELSAGTSTISTSTVATKVAEVQALLAPVLTAAGVTGTDPLTGAFATDGTGYDRMLDAIKVTVTPSSATSTNIEIGIKQQLPDGTAPSAITFTSQTAAASIPALPAIAANTLPPSGTSSQIAAHLAQLTACYALPIITRVNSTVTSGLATGTAANVVATACRSAFFGDDPSTFFGNGARVGRDANNNGAFVGLFRAGATGLVFSQGSYEFSRNNGDIVAGYKSRDLLGNETFDTFVLRQDTDGKLKQIGNQYTYAGGVVPYQQLREFVPQTSSNYYSTGYDLRVPLIANVSYVDVVTPRGGHITLVPGADSMVLPRRNVAPLAASGTTFIRVRSEYAASVGAPTVHPSTPEANLFFVGTEFTEDEIIGIPNQSVWAFNYFTGGSNASGGTLLTTQYYKTRTRANTIAELRTQVWANLSSTTVADMVGRYQANGGLGNGFASLPATTDLATSWLVPTGALPPTQIKLFGNALYFDYANSTTKPGGVVFTSTTNGVNYANGRTSFNDGMVVGSTARSASAIGCANGAIDVNDMGEKHCAVPGPGYLATARQTGFHLWARDPSGREYAHFYAPYTLQ